MTAYTANLAKEATLAAGASDTVTLSGPGGDGWADQLDVDELAVTNRDQVNDLEVAIAGGVAAGSAMFRRVPAGATKTFPLPNGLTDELVATVRSPAGAESAYTVRGVNALNAGRIRPIREHWFGAYSTGTSEIALPATANVWTDVPVGGGAAAAALDVVIPDCEPFDVVAIDLNFVVDITADVDDAIDFRILPYVDGIAGIADDSTTGIIGVTGWRIDPDLEGVVTPHGSLIIRCDDNDIEMRAGRYRLQYRHSSTGGTAKIVSSPILYADGPALIHATHVPREQLWDGTAVIATGQSLQTVPGVNPVGFAVVNQLVKEGRKAVFRQLAWNGVAYDNRIVFDHAIRTASFSHRRIVVLQWGGTADIQAETPAADIYADQVNHANLARQAGADAVIGLTVPAASVFDATKEAIRTELNALMLADASAVYDTVLDVASLPRFADSGSPMFIDGVHFTNEGRDAILAALLPIARNYVP